MGGGRTGAPACVLPSRFWGPLAARGDITWVTGAPARFAASGRAAATAVAGSSFPYRLGRVRPAFSYSQLAPRAVLALCIDDPAHIRVPLLVGLADVMHGRALHLDASPDGQHWTATLSEP